MSLRKIRRVSISKVTSNYDRGCLPFTVNYTACSEYHRPNGQMVSSSANATLDLPLQAKQPITQFGIINKQKSNI